MAPLAARRRQWLPLRRALLLLGVLSEPALAAKASRAGPWGDLFGIYPPKPRAKVHRAAVPLPRPRPADAPERGQPTAEEAAKETTKETGKETAKEAAKETTKLGKPSEQATPRRSHLHPRPAGWR